MAKKAKTKEIKGLEKLIKALKSAPPELQNRINITVEAASFDIAANAKDYAPVDTGTLRRSIAVLNKGDNTYNIKANATGLAPYAAFVEYGTAPHIASNRRRTEAQPFLYPAFYKGLRKINRDVRKLIKNYMESL